MRISKNIALENARGGNILVVQRKFIALLEVIFFFFLSFGELSKCVME